MRVTKILINYWSDNFNLKRLGKALKLIFVVSVLNSVNGNCARAIRRISLFSWSIFDNITTPLTVFYS